MIHNLVENSGSNSEIRRIDPERLEFLQGAVREAMKDVVDPNKLIIEVRDNLSLPNGKFYNIRRVSLPNFFLDEEVLTSLAVIDRCVELPDCALNLEKLGLIQPLLNCLFRSEEIRCVTYQILSKSMQNNLPVQNSFGKLGALPILIQRIQQENSEFTKSKGITAISTLIRHNKVLEHSFLSDDGLSLIISWLQSEYKGTREKALSLLRHLLTEEILVEEYVIENKNCRIIDNIVILSRNNSISTAEYQDIQYSETVSETLLQLVKICNSKLDRASKDKVLEEVTNRMTFLTDYCKIFPNDDISPEYSTLVQCKKLLV